MDIQNILSKHKLQNHTKHIFVLENEHVTKKSLLPFFADGYPGIMYQQTKYGAYQIPSNKKLSEFFMYGQTINPIEISIEGPYRLIIFQLYPFAAKTLFDVNPKELNDDCYDLCVLENEDINRTLKELFAIERTSKQVEVIAALLSRMVQQTINHNEQKIQLAINIIVRSKGRITVKSLREDLHMTERTLQRQFVDYVGISPKQFAKIIQFQSSLNQLSDEAYSNLSDIVHETGYADQSHFIRSFKKFTGKNPSQFKSSK